jgi:hypothetical protein
MPEHFVVGCPAVYEVEELLRERLKTRRFSIDTPAVHNVNFHGGSEVPLHMDRYENGGVGKHSKLFEQRPCSAKANSANAAPTSCYDATMSRCLMLVAEISSAILSCKLALSSQHGKSLPKNVLILHKLCCYCYVLHR